MKPLFTALAIGFISLCSAGNVPVEWTADVDSLAVHEFAARRGETLDLAVSLTYRGKPFTPEGDWEIFYQTNGMADIYFTFPVNLEGNVARLTFTPAMDPGAERITGFIGRRGVNYRAAFALRFYGSPGATPNALTLPTKTIDFAQLEVHNAPWATAADIGNKRSITDLTVYGKDVAKPYALADECRPIEVTVNGTLHNLDKLSLGWSEEYRTVRMNVVTGELGDFYGDDMMVFFEDGVAKSLATQWDGYPEWNLEYRFGGKPFKAGEWPRLKTGISPTADTLLKKSEVADVVRETKGMVWDAKLGVTWKQTMYDGNLYYIAVTNANITEVK